MRFRIEHFHAVEVPGTALGYEFAPTGEVDEIDAHDEADAAASALSGEEAVGEALSYDPGHRLYAVPGEEQAVRVTAITS